MTSKTWKSVYKDPIKAELERELVLALIAYAKQNGCTVKWVK